ncbi:twin-arginine translocation signal domain-containing protein [Patescibacteria group bacterium]|nr:twin-arginine translocation signal domain-containing protein [Patescibacteria group bacterium]MBU1952503.1 twin-arginine translocation signal domain-containing protein [Patescibacteria group bacterium]
MINNEELQSNESGPSLEGEGSSPEQLDKEASALNRSAERETREIMNLASEIQHDPISNYEEKQEAKLLSQKAGITRRDFIKKAALITGAAMLATPNIGRAKKNDAKGEGEGQTENVELSLVEQNRKLLIEGEHEAPREVFRCLAEVISPDNILEPSGGYFNRDYIDTKDEEKEFKKRMKKLGYNDVETQRYRELFSGGSIVFNEKILGEDGFENVLAHERMHKELDNLPEDKKRVLNEARDFILNDYRTRETELNNITDPYLMEVRDKGEEPDYRVFGKMKDEFLKKNSPILLNEDGDMGSGAALMAITRNPREFYTYLMMGELSPRVEEFLKSDFPDAYEIYIGLKNGIYQQIENSKKE